MEKFTVTKEIELDYAHRVPDHKSKCRNMHGHRAKVQVTVEGVLNTEGSDNGMVLDFGDIKQALTSLVHDMLDHRCLLYKEDPLWLWLSGFVGDWIKQSPSTPFGSQFHRKDFGWIVELDVVPTAENLAKLIFDVLAKALDQEQAKVIQVQFWETPTSCATYQRQV